jgi:hypothetical protein
MALTTNHEGGFSVKRLLCPITRPFIDIEISNVIERIIQAKSNNNADELQDLMSRLSEIELDPCLNDEQIELISQWQFVIIKEANTAKKVKNIRSRNNLTPDNIEK